MDAFVLESWHSDLTSDHQYFDDFTLEEQLQQLYTVPTPMIPDHTILISYAEEESDDGDTIHSVREDVLFSHEKQDEPSFAMTLYDVEVDDAYHLDSDDHGEFLEFCFTTDMAKVILDEKQLEDLESDDVATLRVYVSAAAKRAVDVKEDDLLTKQDIMNNPKQVSSALLTELKIWLDNRCFAKELLSKATNIMTSRYVYKWKFVKDESGKEQKIIR